MIVGLQSPSGTQMNHRRRRRNHLRDECLAPCAHDNNDDNNTGYTTH